MIANIHDFVLRRTPCVGPHLRARAMPQQCVPFALKRRFVCLLQYQGELHAHAFDTPHEFHLGTLMATLPELRNGNATLFALQQFELLRGGLLFSGLPHSCNGSRHQNGNTEEQNH